MPVTLEGSLLYLKKISTAVVHIYACTPTGFPENGYKAAFPRRCRPLGAVMLAGRGNIETMFVLHKEFHRDVSNHIICSRKSISDLIVAVEAAKQGVTVGEDTASALKFGDGYMDIRNTRRVAATNGARS